MRLSKNHLSGGADGVNIQISQTATAGDTVHTGPSTTTSFDEVWLYATNTSASDVVLTIEWCGTGTANNVSITVPANDTILVIPGWVIQGNASPLVVAAFAATTNVININGYVNQQTAT
jgi:hypothetical protein